MKPYKPKRYKSGKGSYPEKKDTYKFESKDRTITKEQLQLLR